MDFTKSQYVCALELWAFLVNFQMQSSNAAYRPPPDASISLAAQRWKFAIAAVTAKVRERMQKQSMYYWVARCGLGGLK